MLHVQYTLCKTGQLVFGTIHRAAVRKQNICTTKTTLVLLKVSVQTLILQCILLFSMQIL